MHEKVVCYERVWKAIVDTSNYNKIMILKSLVCAKRIVVTLIKKMHDWKNSFKTAPVRHEYSTAVFSLEKGDGFNNHWLFQNKTGRYQISRRVN